MTELLGVFELMRDDLVQQWCLETIKIRPKSRVVNLYSYIDTSII